MPCNVFMLNFSRPCICPPCRIGWALKHVKYIKWASSCTTNANNITYIVIVIHWNLRYVFFGHLAPEPKLMFDMEWMKTYFYRKSIVSFCSNPE